MREVVDENGKTQKEIFFVDFDYSSYYYRGNDFGRYFSNYRHKEDMFGYEGLPSDEDMKLFFEEYRNESAILNPAFDINDQQNSIENMIMECKVHMLNAYLIDYFFTLFKYCENPKSEQAVYFLVNNFLLLKDNKALTSYYIRNQPENVEMDTWMCVKC